MARRSGFGPEDSTEALLAGLGVGDGELPQEAPHVGAVDPGHQLLHPIGQLPLERASRARPSGVSSTRVTRPSPVSSTASATQPCWRRLVIMAETVGLVTALAAASSPARREPPKR